MSVTKTNTQPGFTIVELLIVIVVIAILAAISIVAFTGIQNRASDAAVQSDLRNLATKVREYRVIHGEYPNGGASNVFPGGIRLAISKSSYDPEPYNIYYCVITGTPDARFAITARSKSGNVFSHTSTGFQEYSGAFGSSANICPNSGIPTSESGYEFHNGYRRNGVWNDWTNG